MKRLRHYRLQLGVLLLIGATSLSSAAGQRPLADFLDQQGTTMVFAPPVPDYIGWSAQLPAPVNFALVDYAGLAAEFLADSIGLDLGTSVTGQITERPLADGRAEVLINLHTKNALTWVSTSDGVPGSEHTNPVLLGFRVQDLLDDPTRTPALGAAHLQVVFINPAPGAPLPDLVDAFILGNAVPGQELISISFRATATGPLHAEAALGPEGTPGRVIVSQTCILFRGPFQGATADGCPVERVELRAIGQ